METMELEAEVRTARGKGPARRLRAQGKLPAVLYGPGLESTPLTLDPKDLLKGLLGEKRRNTVYTLNFGDSHVLAMVKDLDVEPVSRELVHVDFLGVQEDSVIHIHVPLATEGRAVGVVRGGLLKVTTRTVALRTTAANVPVAITVDVTDLAIGDSVTIADLPLPKGVTCTVDPTRVVILLTENKRAIEEEEEAAEAAAAKPGAEAADADAKKE